MRSTSRLAFVDDPGPVECHKMSPVPLCGCANSSVVSVVRRLILVLQYCGLAAKVIIEDPKSAVGVGDEVLKSVEERQTPVSHLIRYCLQNDHIGEAWVLDQIHLMQESVGVENEVVIPVDLFVLETAWIEEDLLLKPVLLCLLLHFGMKMMASLASATTARNVVAEITLS